MVFYKYTKIPGKNRIPGYKESSTTEVVKYLDTNSILSELEGIELNGEKYICNISDGLFYPFRTNTNANFTKSIVVDSIVSPLCKAGIAVFDSTKEERKELIRVNKNQHMIMNMGFITDHSGNIWTSVSVLNDDLSFAVEKGFVIYKNNRNNFANLYIPNAQYTTVLTDGVLDDKKIAIVKEQSPIMQLSNSSIDLSGTTTNTKVVMTDRKNNITVTRTTESARERNYIGKIAVRDPSIIQNNAHFPPVVGIQNGMYQYDYTINCSLINGLNDLSKMRKHENMDVNSIRLNFKKNVSSYNRFKAAMPDDILSRGFMHVFFTRPDCNLLNDAKTELKSDIKNDPSLSYIYKKKPDLVRQLVLNNGESHDFMMLLSNKAKGFNLTDEGINSDKYGKTFGGYSVSFGRRKDAELGGGSFDISYNDTRDLDIINLHKLWIDYINNVYRGKWVPKIEYIYNKIIDYACSVYVILTAEDFETILFWTKYYGVFPVNVPYSGLSWNGNGPITNPEISVTYQYSWKEDYNPLGLTELNINTFRKRHPTSVAYIPTYLPEIGKSGYTWVGAPFVETVHYSVNDVDKTNGAKLTSKLRFKEEES